MHEVIICKFQETDFGVRWFAAFPPDLETIESDGGLTEVFLMLDLGDEACRTEAESQNWQEIKASDPWNLLRHRSKSDPVRFYVACKPKPLPKKKRGRILGFTPSGNPPMVKKTKSWSFPEDDWKWIESHKNQNELIRKAVSSYRKQHS